jgi:hypothetical protein
MRNSFLGVLVDRVVAVLNGGAWSAISLTIVVFCALRARALYRLIFRPELQGVPLSTWCWSSLVWAGVSMIPVGVSMAWLYISGAWTP